MGVVSRPDHPLKTKQMFELCGTDECRISDVV
jgi:hypothetical protein